jgi:hypothetical protein
MFENLPSHGYVDLAHIRSEEGMLHSMHGIRETRT